jgi:RNA methyltransferase, TrmH family
MSINRRTKIPIGRINPFAFTSRYNASMLLSSRSNPRIKHLRALQQRKTRQKFQQFTVEGSGLIQDALQAGFKLLSIYGLEFTSLPNAPETFYLSPELISYVSSLESASEMFGIFACKELTEDAKRYSAWVLAERLQDPGNAGALLRLVDACGWQGILALDGFPDIYSPKVIRASMGSCFRVPVKALDLEALKQWQERNWTLLATSLDAEESSLNCHLPEKLILAVGNEGQGLSQSLMEAAQEWIKIPLYGHVDSLNVATATAMLMHEYLRQQAQTKDASVCL